MGVLRKGMGGQAPRRIKATNPEQIECFENMAAAAKANDVANLQTSIQQLEALVPSQQREGKQFHELNQALKIAIREGHLEAAGALLNVQGVRANDFFTEILASDKAVDFFELFAQHGLRVDELWSSGGVYPLWYDAIPDRLDTLEWLLSHSADINPQEAQCDTPLDRAAEYGSIDAVKFLLDHGADIEQSNVLHFAAGSVRCEKDDPKITDLMEYLISEVGIDVNAVSTTDEKKTALHEAVEAASKTRVSFLLQHGADVTAEDENDLTPLGYARNFGGAGKRGGSQESKDVAILLQKWVDERKTEV